MKKNEILSYSAEETEKVGIVLAENFKQGGILCLSGELGAGKTTFVRGFAKGLGIKQQMISPTFIIMRSYEIESGRKNHEARMFYHVDLYRTTNKNDIEGIGLFDVLKEPENIVVIEWSERLGNNLPENRTDITFDYISDEVRKLTIIKY